MTIPMKSKKMPPSDLESILSILIGIWRRFHKLPGPADRLQTREFRSVVSAVNSLQECFEEGASKIGKDYFSKPELLGGYLLYHWVVHYLQGLSLLGELPFTPKRVLDVCSGPASFAFAALRHGAHEVVATDQNITALTLGAEICGRYGLPLTIRPWNCLKGPPPIEGKFDLIIVGHCLNELFPLGSENWEEGQRHFIRNLLDLLTPKGFLLVVDSSYLEANRRILQLRDRLVSEGIPLQAPCIWKGECPALKVQNSPCYAQREFEKPYLIKEIQRASSINLSSLKMSYLIFRSLQWGWPELPEKKLYRVISPAIESHQGKRFYLCGVDGKKNLGSHVKLHPQESRAFEHLKRGELISIENPLEKQNALDVIKGTRLSVEAACGKPLLETHIYE
jgi:SAM-dependent methyltransferase